jgi:hypothetical protein
MAVGEKGFGGLQTGIKPGKMKKDYRLRDGS